MKALVVEKSFFALLQLARIIIAVLDKIIMALTVETRSFAVDQRTLLLERILVKIPDSVVDAVSLGGFGEMYAPHSFLLYMHKFSVIHVCQVEAREHIKIHTSACSM
jgi:hypothetical protein